MEGTGGRGCHEEGRTPGVPDPGGRRKWFYGSGLLAEVGSSYLTLKTSSEETH